MEVAYFTNKNRFIREIISDTLDIKKKKKDQIELLLAEKQYQTKQDIDSILKQNSSGEAPFDYLLTMNFMSLSHERCEDLENKTAFKSEELEVLMNKTPEDLWMEDLDEFIGAYKQFEQNEIEEMNKAYETVCKRAKIKCSINIPKPKLPSKRNKASSNSSKQISSKSMSSKKAKSSSKNSVKRKTSQKNATNKRKKIVEESEPSIHSSMLSSSEESDISINSSMISKESDSSFDLEEKLSKPSKNKNLNKSKEAQQIGNSKRRDKKAAKMKEEEKEIRSPLNSISSNMQQKSSGNTKEMASPTPAQKNGSVSPDVKMTVEKHSLPESPSKISHLRKRANQIIDSDDE
jgi:DNA topoisomerase II